MSLSLVSLKWFHWLILSLSMLLTLAAYQISQESVKTNNALKYEREAAKVTELIIERLELYETALLSGAALINAQKGQIDYPVWKSFAESLQIDRTYPGINGIGVIYNVQGSEIESFVMNKQQELPSFNNHPSHSNDDKWPITYIVPLEPNKNALGLDIAFEDNRYNGVIRARDLGIPQITGPITLVQDKQQTPGFLFYVPFYEEGRIPTTVEGRQTNIKGVTYAPFIIRKLLDGTLAGKNRHLIISIFDEETNIYNDRNYDLDTDLLVDGDPMFKSVATLPVYGRNWTFELESSLGFRQAANQSQPYYILIAGLFIECLLIILFVHMVNGRKQAMKIAAEATKDLRSKTKELAVKNKELSLRNKEVEEANLTKSEFLSNMSHEIRTPMNGVLMSLSLVQSEDLPSEAIKLIDTAASSANQLLVVINDILDIEKLESGNITINKRSFCFTNLIESIFRLMEPLANDKGLELRVHVAENVPKWLIADHVRIQQIVINLVNNAIKFTDEGFVELSVAWNGNGSTDDGRLHIAVKDTGTGISKDNIDKVFDRFKQLENKKATGGTGLGLAISKQLVTVMGGKIDVESDGETGSEFWFDLPLKKSAPAKYSGNDRREKSRGAFRILVAEDVPINQILIEKTLRKLGHDVIMVNNGQEAVNLVAEKQFDLILMDNNMPIMTGVEAFKEIRAAAHQQSMIPIIAITADALTSQQDHFMKVGFNAFVAKPIDTDKLEAEIQRVMA